MVSCKLMNCSVRPCPGFFVPGNRRASGGWSCHSSKDRSPVWQPQEKSVTPNDFFRSGRLRAALPVISNTHSLCAMSFGPCRRATRSFADVKMSVTRVCNGTPRGDQLNCTPGAEWGLARAEYAGQRLRFCSSGIPIQFVRRSSPCEWTVWLPAVHLHPRTSQEITDEVEGRHAGDHNMFQR